MATARSLRYLVTIHARVCACQQAPFVIGRTANLDRAVKVISGYWAVYLGFFGDQLVWLAFQITNTETGRVEWRNGRLTPPGKADDGRLTDEDDAAAAG